jgi:hypothetical protein
MKHTNAINSLTNVQLAALDAMAEKVAPVETVNGPRGGIRFQVGKLKFFYFADAIAHSRALTFGMAQTATTS